MYCAEGGANALEESGLLRRRRPGYPGNPPRPSTTGRSHIPKGDGSLGANHRQFPRSQERKRDGSVTQDDHPKSWDGTLWASGERPSTRVARTETTLSCGCTIPSTRRKGSATSAIRRRARRCGVTITLAMPVSSSRER